VYDNNNYWIHLGVLPAGLATSIAYSLCFPLYDCITVCSSELNALLHALIHTSDSGSVVTSRFSSRGRGSTNGLSGDRGL
jgi:hypothetical protein